MKSGRGVWGLIATVAAFVGLLVVFGLTIFAFRANVERWARRDLLTQAELTAENLREPLATEDYRRLGEIARQLAEKEMMLRVRSTRGGWIFKSDYRGRTVEESAPCGEFTVSVGLSTSRVHKPFYDALGGFVLSALVGVLAMGVVFFTFYRQWVRINELNRLERFRRDFIADFSHELKTPLTGILGAVDLLSDSVLTALIRKEATRLNELATSMLELARLERAGNGLKLEMANIEDILLEVRTRFMSVAESNGIAIDCANGLELAPAMDKWVLLDREQIARAVSNLVENAILHSGGTRLTLAAQFDDKELLISVADDGVGIPATERKRIFERFYRVERSRTTPGSGLGLAIARSIARLHGGDLTYVPVEPHGSRFLLSLTIR